MADVTVGGVKYELGLWDTAGQEDYDRLRPLSYDDTDVILICFAIDSKLSYENIPEKWLPEVQQFCPGVPLILVGTKSDFRNDPELLQSLADKGRAPVAADEGEALRAQIGAVRYIECSAKTNYNLEEVMSGAVGVVVDSMATGGRSCCVLL